MPDDGDGEWSAIGYSRAGEGENCLRLLHREARCCGHDVAIIPIGAWMNRT